MKCKNDPTRSYAGTEPSPKGLGLCAHAERPGLVTAGKNGGLWIVALDKNGRRSWKPFSAPPDRNSKQPMTVQRAFDLLSIADPTEADSIVSLKVAKLKADAAGASRVKDLAHRFLLKRMCRRKLVPSEAICRFISGERMKKPIEYDRLQTEAIRIFEKQKGSA